MDQPTPETSKGRYVLTLPELTEQYAAPIHSAAFTTVNAAGEAYGLAVEKDYTLEEALQRCRQMRTALREVTQCAEAALQLAEVSFLAELQGR